MVADVRVRAGSLARFVAYLTGTDTTDPRHCVGDRVAPPYIVPSAFVPINVVLAEPGGARPICRGLTRTRWHVVNSAAAQPVSGGFAGRRSSAV